MMPIGYIWNDGTRMEIKLDTLVKMTYRWFNFLKKVNELCGFLYFPSDIQHDHSFLPLFQIRDMVDTYASKYMHNFRTASSNSFTLSLASFRNPRNRPQGPEIQCDDLFYHTTGMAVWDLKNDNLIWGRLIPEIFQIKLKSGLLFTPTNDQLKIFLSHLFEAV